MLLKIKGLSSLLQNKKRLSVPNGKSVISRRGADPGAATTSQGDSSWATSSSPQNSSHPEQTIPVSYLLSCLESLRSRHVIHFPFFKPQASCDYLPQVVGRCYRCVCECILLFSHFTFLRA